MDHPALDFLRPDHDLIDVDERCLVDTPRGPVYFTDLPSFVFNWRQALDDDAGYQRTDRSAIDGNSLLIFDGGCIKHVSNLASLFRSLMSVTESDGRGKMDRVKSI